MIGDDIPGDEVPPAGLLPGKDTAGYGCDEAGVVDWNDAWPVERAPSPCEVGVQAGLLPETGEIAGEEFNANGEGEVGGIATPG